MGFLHTKASGGGGGGGSVTGVTASSPLTSSGGTAPNIALSTSGATAGTYSNVTVTVDAYGRVTSISSGQPTAEYAFGNSGSTPAVNFSNGVNQAITLNANATPTFSNPVNGTTYLLRLTQDGTGTRLVTWPAGVKWQNSTPPQLSVAAGATDIITLYYNGTNYFGTYGDNYG